MGGWVGGWVGRGGAGGSNELLWVWGRWVDGWMEEEEEEEEEVFICTSSSSHIFD